MYYFSFIIKRNDCLQPRAETWFERMFTEHIQVCFTMNIILPFFDEQSKFVTNPKENEVSLLVTDYC